MLSVSLPASIEQRLTKLAKSRGLSEGDLVRQMIEAGIDDFDAEQSTQRRIKLLQAEGSRPVGRERIDVEISSHGRRQRADGAVGGKLVETRTIRCGCGHNHTRRIS